MKKRFIVIITISCIILISLLIIIFINSDKNKHKRYSKILEQENILHRRKLKIAKLYLKSAEELNEPDEMIRANNILGTYYQSAHNIKKSNEYFLKSYDIARDSKKYKVKSDICYKIGTNYLKTGEYIDAHKFAIEALSIEENHKYSDRSAETLNLLGSIYEKTGLYIKSLARHYESLELQKEKKNSRGIANSYHNLAHLYFLNKRYDKAYSFYTNALNLYKKLNPDSADLMIINSNIVNINIAIGNYFITLEDSVNAMLYLNKALSLSKKYNDSISLAHSLSNIGNLYFRLKKFSKACMYYMRASEIYKIQNNKIGDVTTGINLGFIYYYYYNWRAKAIETLKESLNTSIEINANLKTAELSNLLYNIYKEYPDSINEIKKYNTLLKEYKKYFLNEATQDSILQMSVKYEVTAEKNKEISIEKLEKRNLGILLSSFLFIAIFLFIFIFYRHKTKQEAAYKKKLADEERKRFKDILTAIEKERKRITIDLHDSVGQMLSTTKLYFSGLEELVEKENEHEQMLYNEAVKLLDESSAELRNISYNIMPGSLIKYGLKSAVDELTAKVSKGSKIIFVLKSKGFEKRDDETLEILLYRIIQETINNIIKHSEATKTDISIIEEDNKIYLSIADNGKGMEDFKLYQNKGMGWKSIFSRVQILNGKIKVDTETGKGTKIEIVIPV